MKLDQKTLQTLTAILFLTAMTLPTLAAEKTLPDPDGEPANMTKPVQVYIPVSYTHLRAHET